VKFSTHQDNRLVITFDDSKTQLSRIQKALRKGGITPVGKPVYLEQGAVPPAANWPAPGTGQANRVGTGS
jgi:hypothetical protein